jgi:2-hydroxychromene-2-carboxylate isomerase
MPRLEFWYEFASTYSYLSAMRIESLARPAGLDVVWRPFLLGPIFRSQGWETSPFNLYPAKGRYMVRDLQRLAASRGLEFRMPGVFPANGLKAARLALVGAEDGWIARFTRGLYSAEFGRGADIASDAVLETVLVETGVDPASVRQRAEGAEVKQRLKDQTAEAQMRGIFGAPTFITEDGELFWGDDRLEQAVAWATRQGTNLLPASRDSAN